MKYNTTVVDFQNLKKKLSPLIKKMTAAGVKITFVPGETFVKEVPVYAVDEITHAMHRTGQTEYIECIEYEFDMEPYKIGDYRFGAVVKRTLEDNVNAVYVQEDENAADFSKYRTGALVCEHCRKNHARNKCVILIDNTTGAHKMVGTKCAKDFAGYDLENFSKWFEAIDEIIYENKEPWVNVQLLGNYKVCVDVREYLARCIYRVDRFGYNRDTTKYDAMKDMKTPIEDKWLSLADEVINFFNTNEFTDPFEHNIKMYLTGKLPVTNANGIVAYAFVSYKKILDRIAKENARNAAMALSDYVGNPGDKIQVIGKIELVCSWESNYGYKNYEYLYKITDESGNVYVWKTSSFPDVIVGNECIPANRYSETGKVKFTMTIKDHKEYDHKGCKEKQTVVTRVKCEAA